VNKRQPCLHPQLPFFAGHYKIEYPQIKQKSLTLSAGFYSLFLFTAAIQGESPFVVSLPNRERVCRSYI